AAGNTAAVKVNPPLRPGMGPIGPMGPGAPPRAGFGPTMDGRIISLRSFNEAAPEISKNIPMLLGSVSEEGNSMRSKPTEAEWRANLARAYGEEKAAALVAALKKAH